MALPTRKSEYKRARICSTACAHESLARRVRVLHEILAWTRYLAAEL